LLPSNYLLSSSEGGAANHHLRVERPTTASGNFAFVFLAPQSRNGPTAILLGIQADLTQGKGVAVRPILREILLFSCMALFITGIVVALASLLL
jgi:hypothetical protein